MAEKEHVTDQPYVFTYRDVQYQAHQDGTIERKDGEKWNEIDHEEGMKIVLAHYEELDSQPET